jgi:predicted amidohydrolase YtcJ
MNLTTLYENALLYHPGGRVSPGSLAVFGDRILALGDPSSTAEAAGPGAAKVDLGGGSILPGIHDGHSHMMFGAFTLSQVDLRTATSREEFEERVRGWCQANPDAPWVLGGQWDDQAWGGSPPDKTWVDRLVPDRPLYLTRYDMHSALVNTRTLELVGITADTPDPDGGRIERDPASGDPTGLLIEQAAMDLILAHVPEPSDAAKADLLTGACDYAASLGIVRVQDMPLSWDDLSAYRLALSGDRPGPILHLRVPIEYLENLLAAKNDSWPDRMKLDGVKAWTDGTLGSHSAWLRRPYADQPDNYGVPWVKDLEGFKERVKQAAAADVSVSIHGIGDAAIGYNLDCFWECIDRNLGRAPLRIEHFQHPAAEDVARTDHPRLIVSFQPLHLRYDALVADQYLGPDRANLSFPIKTILGRRALVVLGSDWAVSDFNPFLGIHAAVTRKDIHDRMENGWIPEEKLTVPEAVDGYTRAAAAAVGLDGQTGQLKPGLLADLTVVDRDVTAVDPDEIKDTRVLMTVAEGRVIYDGR